MNDRVAVDRKVLQPGNEHRGDVSKDLGAGYRVECMEHAVVRADVDARLGRIMVVVERLRMDDVAEHSVAGAEAPERRLVGAVTADVIEDLFAIHHVAEHCTFRRRG